MYCPDYFVIFLFSYTTRVHRYVLVIYKSLHTLKLASVSVSAPVSIAMSLPSAFVSVVLLLPSAAAWTCVPISTKSLHDGVEWRKQNCTKGDPVVDPPSLTINSIHVDLTREDLRVVPAIADPEQQVVSLQPCEPFYFHRGNYGNLLFCVCLCLCVCTVTVAKPSQYGKAES